MAQKKIFGYFYPLQLGVAVRGGGEAAVHSTRSFLGQLQQDEVIAKLDFANAFNTIHRAQILKAVSREIPELYRFCHSAYSGNSLLQFGHNSVNSCTGVQQGDPLGPLLFSLSIHPILESLNSPLKFAYLDDVTLGGPAGVVNADVDNI